MPPSGAPREPGTPAPDPTGTPQAREDLETTVRLLESVARGDERARNRLVRRYLPLMLRWAHGRLPGVARALDDTQSLVLDTLQSALSHVEKFECRREGAFLAYLRTIFMNKLRDRCRGARPRGEPLWDIPAPGDPEEDMRREELWAAYDSALAKLPERMREAVFLRLELEWEFVRIAEAIGSPTANAARMYVTRGIRRLAKEMNGAAF